MSFGQWSLGWSILVHDGDSEGTLGLYTKIVVVSLAILVSAGHDTEPTLFSLQRGIKEKYETECLREQISQEILKSQVNMFISKEICPIESCLDKQTT